MEITGKPVFVQPVAVYPGWFVKMENISNCAVWVLSPKALPKFIRNERDKLSEPEVNLITSHQSLE